MPEYPAELAGIVDGDTMDYVLQFAVDLPLLWRITVHLTVPLPWRIRLAGLNAPEVSTPEGVAARKWVQDWFVANPGPYTLTTATHDRRDNYGRLLATVHAPDGACLNQDLLDAGQAVVYRLNHEVLAEFGLVAA